MILLEKLKNVFAVKKKRSGTEAREQSVHIPDADVATLGENGFFTLLSEALEKNNNQAILFGAVSMGVYGYQRNTLDIDFMVPEDDFSNFTSIIESIGYQKILQTSQYAKFRHENDVFMDIDTVFITADTASEIRKLAEVKKIRGGNTFLCASFETVLATKLHAIKYNNESRGGKDITDLKMLLKANNINVDSEWFKTLCIKYGGEDVYDNIFAAKGKEG
jgi:hypothetical protein